MKKRRQERSKHSSSSTQGARDKFKFDKHGRGRIAQKEAAIDIGLMPKAGTKLVSRAITSRNERLESEAATRKTGLMKTGWKHGDKKKRIKELCAEGKHTQTEIMGLVGCSYNYVNNVCRTVGGCITKERRDSLLRKEIEKHLDAGVSQTYISELLNCNRGYVNHIASIHNS